MNPISAYGASIAGIQAIKGRIGASPRPRPQDSEEGSDKDGGEGADPEADTPQPPAPGIGRLVDKSA